MRRALLLLVLLALLPMPVTAQEEILDLRDELRSCWNMDEIAGTRYDTVGYANLTDVNTVTHLLGVSPATKYAAFTTAGNAEYLNGNDVHDLTDSFTITGWIKSDNLPSGALNYFINNNTNNAGQYWLYQYNTNYLMFRLVTTSANVAYSADSTWHFFVAMYDADLSQTSLSLDLGTPTIVAQGTAPYYDSSGFKIGGNHTSYYDTFALWQRVLTDAEQEWLYNSGAGRTCNEIANIYDENPREIITLSSGKLGQLTRSISYGDVAVSITVLMLVGLTLVKEFREFIHSHTENKS